jgi:hypothetical protein
MNTSTDFTIDEILGLDPKVITEALTLFGGLVYWVDNDVFTNTPERANSVAGAESTLQLARQIMRQIDKAIRPGPSIQEPREPGFS